MRCAIALLLFAASIGIHAAFGVGAVNARPSDREGSSTASRDSVQATSAPRFENFSVTGLEENHLGDSEPNRHWCGPFGVARFHWTIAGGTEPVQLTVAGQPVDADELTVDIPCAQMRKEYLSGPQPADSVIDVLAEATDSDNRRASASIAIGFVSDAPQTQIEEVSVVAGVHDVFFYIDPWPYSRTPTDPVGRLALVRYRTHGTTAWSYTFPLPEPPQNSCGYWCARPHVSDLERDKDYEYQAAWMWLDLPWGWRDSLPSGEARWRSWTSPEAMNWTDTQRFRTYGAEEVAIEATDHSLTVAWRPRGGKVHTWLTSPDWPGAIWTDPENSYRWPGPTIEQEAGWSTTIFHGLPADTRFTVTFKRTLPVRFVQAEPQEYQVRTKQDQAPLTPGVFDPRSVRVALVDDKLQVEWNGHSPDWWAVVSLRDASGFPIGHTRLSYRRSYSLSLPNADVKYVQRQQMVIERFDKVRETVLFLNLRPDGRMRTGGRYPFVCMAWKIELPPTNPDLTLDWYFHSAWLKSRADTTPTKSYWVSSDGNWPYSRCVLGDSVGP